MKTPSQTQPDAISATKNDSTTSASRRWMLTIPARSSVEDEAVSPNGVKLYSLEDIRDELDVYAGWVGQLERGESHEEDEEGYLHFQVYVEHSSAVRFKTLKKKFPQAHLEAARSGRQACGRYVTKEETRVLGPFSHGEIAWEDFQGKRNDLTLLTDMIREGVSAEELIYTDANGLRHATMLRNFEAIHLKRTVGRKYRDVEVEYRWGKSGTGKTKGIFAEFGYDDVYRVVDYAPGFMDQYSGEKVLLLDEFRSEIHISKLLAMLEGHPLQVSARYSNKWAAWEKVIIVSNESLDELYYRSDGSDRLTKETRKALKRRIHHVRQYVGFEKWEDCSPKPTVQVPLVEPIFSDVGELIL